MDKILSIIAKNARLTNAQIAVMAGESEACVAAAIEKYEQAGIIRGYKAVVDWDKTDREYVSARIELKVIPKKGHGFDEIAKAIAEFEEVETVYLMSGSYDLALTVSGKSFKDIAMFTAHRLAQLESVTSTSTLFVLKKYKERGTIVFDNDRDLREAPSI